MKRMHNHRNFLLNIDAKHYHHRLNSSLITPKPSHLHHHISTTSYSHRRTVLSDCCNPLHLTADLSTSRQSTAKSPLPSESVWATDMNGLNQRAVCLEKKKSSLYYIDGITNVTCYKTVSSDSCVAAAFCVRGRKGGLKKYHRLPTHPHTLTTFTRPTKTLLSSSWTQLLPALVCQDFRVTKNNQKEDER